MLDFLVVGFPRSATTWVANWLTTERSLCLHDPFASMTFEELIERHHPTKLLGVSDTGLWCRPDMCARLARRVAVIHRDPAEVQRSMNEIGLGDYWTARGEWVLDAIDGRHIRFEDLFKTDAAERLFDHLLPGIAFDRDRHALLREFNVEPDLAHSKMDVTKARAFLKEVTRGVLCQ